MYEAGHQEYILPVEKYKELEETFLAIRKEVNNAESQFGMYSYATSI